MTPPVAVVVPEQPASMTPAEPRRLAVNFLFLSVGESTAKLLTFATFSYLARALGPLHYGALEFTMAVMVFFTLPGDLGVGAYGAREIARNPSQAPRLLREIMGLRVLLTLLSMAALAMVILLLGGSRDLSLLLGLYGVSLLGGPVLLQWFFQAHDQMHWVGLASIVRQAVFAGLVLLAARPGLPLVYIGVFECASVAATAAFCLLVVRYRMGYAWSPPELRARHLVRHIREALPIGLSELAWAFMWYFCTVLLGLLFVDSTVGWFGASHRILMALNTFVWLYFFNLLPSISRCSTRPVRQLLDLMNQSIRLMAWTGLFAAGLLTALAPALLTLVYGPLFRSAWPSFAVLAWMLPIAMLSGHHRYILVAYNRQTQLLWCTALSAAAAVLLGCVLVPLYRGPGAAWALLVANAINFALVYLAVRRLVVEVPVHRELAGPLVALAAAAASYLMLAHRSQWLAAGGGCSLYVAGFLWSDGRQAASFLRTLLRDLSGKARVSRP